MATYTVEVTSDGHVAHIVLTEHLLGFPTWECSEGILVWGDPFKGTTLSPNLTGGLVQLGADSGFHDWNADRGNGYRIDANGGSFPAQDFKWKRV